jgi:hypothetical protein
MSAKSAILLLSLLGLLAGCSEDSGLTPEEKVQAFLDRMEEAVESRSLDRVSELISDSYGDDMGRDQREMKRLAMGYFLRNKSIHILKQVDEITILNENSASVRLYAGMAGSQSETLEGLGGWRGDLIALELDLQKEGGGEWKVKQAKWRQASRESLF